MSPDPDPADRQARLQHIRAEIEQALAAGESLDRNSWRARHPDLLPELDTLLDVLQAQASTLGATVDYKAPPDESTLPGPGRLTGHEETAAGTGANLNETVDAGATPHRSTVMYQSGADEGVDVGTVRDPGSGGDPGRPPEGPTKGGVQPPSSRPPGTRPPSRPPSPEEYGPLPAGQRVRYIGDYELLKVLGRGGMGIVYRARQLSLNRNVAIKMIRNAEFAGEVALRRFQNEAEAVALLDHPGIVPIYEVGAFEDQRYFSMKLIEGDSLEGLLPALAKDPKAAATLMAEVAEAVHHAHQRGILHRDLKPPNVLVDGTGHPHVTDFGLARKIEEDSGLTVTGAIMGTPAFMAPEQALGRNGQVTVATDVYGLGSTFYAMLTGKPPFKGDSILETLELVRHNPPPPPSKVNADLPRDLEVICLKCLEKDPARRYATAQELADDLHRWLNHEPISARPVDAFTRARMWCRRKPALASMIAALALALVGGVAGITWQWREAVYQRKEAVTARDRAVKGEAAARTAEAEALASEKAAKEARDQAEKNANLAGMQATLALNTIQEIISQVSEKMNGPGLFDIKSGLLDTALKRVDGVASNYDKSTSKEATTAAALFQLAAIYRQLGQSEKSTRTFEKVLGIAKERIVVKKGSDGARQNLALAYTQLGLNAEEFQRDMNKALDYHLKARDIWQDVIDHPKPEGFPLPPGFALNQLGDATHYVGISYHRLGELPKARDYFLKAYNIRRELLDKSPDDPNLTNNFVFSCIALGDTAMRLEDNKGAENYLKEALDRREKLLKANPTVIAAKHGVGDAVYTLGDLRLRLGELDAARALHERALAIRRECAAADPNNAYYQRNLAISLDRMGDIFTLLKEPRLAGPAYEEAIKTEDELVKRDPLNDKRQTELMLTLGHAGQVDRAREIADRLAAGPKLDRELRVSLASVYAQCARATGPDKAETQQTFYVKAMDMLRAAFKDGYRDTFFLLTEPDLDPLRKRNDFQDLIKQMKAQG